MKLKISEFLAVLCVGMFFFLIGVVIISGDYLPVATMFYALGILGGFIMCSMLQSIEVKNTLSTTTFKRYGQTWYATRQEAEENRQPPDTIVYDNSFDKYYIKEVK